MIANTPARFAFALWCIAAVAGCKHTDSLTDPSTEPAPPDAAEAQVDSPDLGPTATPIDPAHSARYLDTTTQSPLPKVVVERLRALAAVGVAHGLEMNVATKAG